MNDHDLLKAYAESKSEDAFAELVRRNIDLVYSAALRQVSGDTHLAQDVVQTVFNDLARKAGSLSSRVILSGWLYTSARYAAAKIVRTEQRRRKREQESQSMNELLANDKAPDWEQLQCVLDDAMHELKDVDRNAILLRYFQSFDYEHVGEKIGCSADSARMRVDRALEKLRKQLAKRGVVSTSAALAILLAEQTTLAAPAGIAATVASSAIAAAATGPAVTVFHFMAISKLKAAALLLIAAGVAVPIVLQHSANQKLAQTNQSLARENSQAAAELEPLKQEVARLNALISQKKTTPADSNEVFQLRAEVARLREEAKATGRTKSIMAATEGGDTIHDTLRSLGLRAEELKKRLAQMPELQIPELGFVSDKDWLDAAATVEALQSDAEARRALESLRSRAKQKLAPNFQAALRKFAEANGDMLPTNVNQLQPYLDPPLDSSVLQRYKMIQAGNYTQPPSNEDTKLIEEIAPSVDPEYDSRIWFYRHGVSIRSVDAINEAIENAAEQFAQANNGILPRNATQLTSLLPADMDPDRIEKFLAKIPADVTTLAQFRAAKK